MAKERNFLDKLPTVLANEVKFAEVRLSEHRPRYHAMSLRKQTL